MVHDEMSTRIRSKNYALNEMGRQRNTAVDTCEKYVIVEMGRQRNTAVDTREKYAYYFREFENYFFLNK